MKKLVMSSVLAVSSGLALMGATQVNAATSLTTNQAQAVSSNWQDRAAAKGDGEHRGNYRKGGKGDMSRGAFSKLNLTDTQKTQIKAIRQAQRDAHKNDRAANKAKRQQQHEQMQALINSPTLNTSTLNSLANERAIEAKERFVEKVQTQRAIAQVLTAEQRSQLEQMHEERDERRGGGQNR